LLNRWAADAASNVNQGISVFIVILAAVIAANLPFVSQRLLLVKHLSQGKTLWVRLAELLFFYLLVGGIGLGLEMRLGQIAPQKWEFYAITGALFLTLAFPGFVWRYLFKHKG
jgi:Protein of unknown function (DUF2818)